MRLSRGPLRGVAAATLIMLGALTAWTMVTPAFRSADEPTHFSAVSRLARLHTWPTVGHVYQDPAVPAAISAVGFVDVPWADNPALGDPSPGQGPDAPTMVELRDQSTVTTGLEASSIHPPGYYAFLAGFYNGLGLDRATPSGALLSLRLAGLLLVLPIPYLWRSPPPSSASAVAARLPPRSSPWDGSSSYTSALASTPAT